MKIPLTAAKYVLNLLINAYFTRCIHCRWGPVRICIVLCLLIPKIFLWSELFGYGASVASHLSIQVIIHVMLHVCSSSNKTKRKRRIEFARHVQGRILFYVCLLISLMNTLPWNPAYSDCVVLGHLFLLLFILFLGCYQVIFIADWSTYNEHFPVLVSSWLPLVKWYQ